MRKRLLTEEQFISVKEKFPHYTNRELAEEFGTSVSYIRDLGYRMLWLKSAAHNAEQQSIRQKKYHQKKAKNMHPVIFTENVTSKVEWLRSFQAGQQRTAQFQSPKDCQTLSVLISRWNIEEGMEKGLKLKATYNRVMAQVTVTATKI